MRWKAGCQMCATKSYFQQGYDDKGDRMADGGESQPWYSLSTVDPSALTVVE